MLPTISLCALDEVHKKQALIKEKMLGSGFGCSTRTCLNRVDVKIANVPHKDWDAYAVKMSLHLQDTAQQVLETGHADWPFVFTVSTSGDMMEFNTCKSLGKATATGDTVVDFVFALNALSTRQGGRDPLFFLRFTLLDPDNSPCAKVDTEPFLNKSRKCKLNESHQRRSVEARDFTATTEHRSKLRELKRSCEALREEQTRANALRQRIDQLTNENRSLLDENSALRRHLQTQPALLGGGGSPCPPPFHGAQMLTMAVPPVASPSDGGWAFTLVVPPGARGGQEVRALTPFGMAAAVVPAELKEGDVFQIRLS